MSSSSNAADHHRNPKVRGKVFILSPFRQQQPRLFPLLLLLLLFVLSGVPCVHSQTRSQRNNNNSLERSQATFNSWAAGPFNCSCARDMVQLKKEMEEGKRQRQEMQGSLETYVSELHDLKAMVRSLSNDDGRRTPRAEKYNSNAASLSKRTPTISFSAKMSYNRELKPLDIVIFDTVVTNNGEGYNAETGKFTAPLAGTYAIFSTILSGYNTKVETALIVNDKEVARMYSGAHDAHGSGSNAAILNLKSGDSVWVRLLYQGGSHVHGYYSTLSGALLTEEQEEATK